MDGQWRRSYQATVTDDTTSGLSSSHTDYQWSHTNTVGTQHTVSDGVDYSTTPMDGTYNNDVLVKYVPDKSRIARNGLRAITRPSGIWSPIFGRRG